MQATNPTLSQMLWEAQPKQQEFLHVMADEAMYGGAAGGGKSDALMAFAIMYAEHYPGAKILILRRTLVELTREGSLIPRSHELLGNTHWRWQGQAKKWRNPNGSVIEFGYCEAQNDVYKYQSAQYEVIIFDELTHFTEYQYLYLFSRCRSPRGFPKAIRSATNPGNIGHGWVRRRFIDVGPPGEIHTEEFKNPFTKETQKMTRVFIPARVVDNKFLIERDPNYVMYLMNLPDAERRALLDGDWDSFAGQYFNEWRKDLHTCRPFQIPDFWKRFITLDWGMAKPTACLWIALAPNGRAYVYRELYISKEIASVVGAKIYELSKDDVAGQGMKAFDLFTADPSVFQRKGEGEKSIGVTLQEKIGYDLMISPSKNDRVIGWTMLREWFAPAPDGLPWLQFFNTCLNSIRTIPELIHDDKHPEDVDSDGEDHCGDSIRYWAVRRTRQTIVPEEKPYEKLPDKDYEFWRRWHEEKKKLLGKGGGKLKDIIDIM